MTSDELALGALLPAAPVESPPVEAEPVAWRWRLIGESEWRGLSASRQWIDWLNKEKVETQPLYATPIPSPAADVQRPSHIRKLIEDLRPVVERSMALSQVSPVFQNFVDHLSAIAYAEENAAATPAPAGTVSAEEMRERCATWLEGLSTERDRSFADAAIAIRSLSTDREGV